MRRLAGTSTIAWMALLALLGGVAPVAALAGLCGGGSECPMMVAVESHCQPQVAVTSGDCCAEMNPAADVPQLPAGSMTRQALETTSFWLNGSAEPVRQVGGIVESSRPAARGTPLYTLHLALLN